MSIVRTLIGSSDEDLGRQAAYIPIVLVRQLQYYSPPLQGPITYFNPIVTAKEGWFNQ